MIQAAHTVIIIGHEKNKAIQDVKRRERQKALAELEEQKKKKTVAV